MTQRNREQRIRYKLDADTPVSANEMKIYNVPFAGNTNTCRETFLKGERLLEYNIDGDLTLDLVLEKPMFRDEMVEYLHSISRQLVSLLQSGLKLERVVFDLRFMYIRLKDFSVQLIYLPFDNMGQTMDVTAFLRSFLSRLVCAHTAAVECANQISEYLDFHNTFDVFSFHTFVNELRAKSQLLLDMEDASPETQKKAANEAKATTGLLRAKEAVRQAEMARMQAENEAKRLTEYAKQQEEVAKAAEQMRTLAEAARIQAEIERQAAEKEYNDQSKTAVLYACKMKEQTEEAAIYEMATAKLSAEQSAKQAEEKLKKASAESERFAEEVRTAREEEMRAEEARMRAEYEARRSAKEAKKHAAEVKRGTEEIGRLAGKKKDAQIAEFDEAETTVLSEIPEAYRHGPVLTRKKTGERIYINKQIFCIGKADQGVDFKITDNKSVSRRHAYITNINGIYYLKDNNSTNHTYLNGDLLYSNVEVMIPDKSTIRISNEEFIFEINE